MIQGLWDCHFDATIDVKLGDAHADTYKYESMTSLLARWENIKRDKHGKHCHYKQKKIAACYFSGRNAREGIPGRDISTE